MFAGLARRTVQGQQKWLPVSHFNMANRFVFPGAPDVPGSRHERHEFGRHGHKGPPAHAPSMSEPGASSRLSRSLATAVPEAAAPARPEIDSAALASARMAPGFARRTSQAAHHSESAGHRQAYSMPDARCARSQDHRQKAACSGRPRPSAAGCYSFTPASRRFNAEIIRSSASSRISRDVPKFSRMHPSPSAPNPVPSLTRTRVRS